MFSMLNIYHCKLYLFESTLNCLLNGMADARVCYILNTVMWFNFLHRKRHYSPAHKKEAVSDWLNLHSLGTISAFGCIENLA